MIIILTKRRLLQGIGKDRHNNLSCATLIQRYPVTFTKSSIHLVCGLIHLRYVFCYAIATQELFGPIHYQFFDRYGQLTATSDAYSMTYVLNFGILS